MHWKYKVMTSLMFNPAVQVMLHHKSRANIPAVAGINCTPLAEMKCTPTAGIKSTLAAGIICTLQVLVHDVLHV